MTTPLPPSPLKEALLLPQALEASVRQFARLPALEYFGRRWSYRRLGQLVDAAAAGLQKVGVGPGVKVGLCLPNTPYSVILYYAVLKAGGVVVNYNPLYVPRELAQQIDDSGTTMMAVPDLPDIQNKLSALIGQTALQTLIVCPMAEVLPLAKGLGYRLTRSAEMAARPRDGRHIGFRDLIRMGPTPVAVPLKAEDLALLQYTGGTTGVPKGVMLSHGNLAANVVQTLSVMGGRADRQERLVAVLPLFHVFAMTAVMNCAIHDGSEILLLPRFEVKALLKLIARYQATVLHAVPTIYGAINAAAEESGADLRSIHFCISGGAPLPADVAQRFQTLTGCVLAEGYGLSEASPVVCCNPKDGSGKPGSVGRPLPGTTIEIRDPADPGQILPVGGRGEVCVRGPQVMSGYWNRPDDTAEVFFDGALRTGDVGYLDEDGFLFLVDRLKDLIISSGYKVYPRIIEEALYTHPDVREAIVIGTPDPYRGQSPKAFVALRPGSTATAGSLLEFLSGQISKIEMPKEVVIRDALPKTAIGKPSKKDLIEQEKAAAEAESRNKQA